MVSSHDESKKFRVLICGFAGVGKSALMIRFATDHFFDWYDPTVEDCYHTMATVDGVSYTFFVFESAGCEEESARMRREMWMKTSPIPFGVLILYDITSRRTFDEVQNYVDEVKSTMKEQGCNDFPVFLCGTKCDLTDMREVQMDEGLDLARSLGCPFIEVSSKIPVNVQQPFFDLARLYGQGNNNIDRSRSKDSKHGKCIVC